MSRADFRLSVNYNRGGCFLKGSNRRHPIREIRDHELIMVRQGELAMYEKGDAGRRNWLLGAHQFLYLEPGYEHGGYADYSPDLSFYWFHFDCAAQAQIPKQGHFRRMEIAADLASRLLDEQDRDDGPAGTCNLLMQLLLLECTAVQDPTRQDPSGLVDQANVFIAHHFREAISTRDVAQHCGCHPDHLGRVYQARMHMSLTRSIRERRLRHARSLLRDSDDSIEEIARAAGFTESHYFRRCFKAATGSSPVAWRSMHRRQFTN